MAIVWYFLGLGVAYVVGSSIGRLLYKGTKEEGATEERELLHRTLERFAEEHNLRITGTDYTGKNIEYTIRKILGSVKSE